LILVLDLISLLMMLAEGATCHGTMTCNLSIVAAHIICKLITFNLSIIQFCK